MINSSRLIEEAVDQIASLPGVGRKTALRFVLNLLKRDVPEVERFAKALVEMRTKIAYCKQCHNISDRELCTICLNPHRNQQLICVVEDMRDVMAIESTQQYNGVYHVLGGKISPMNGVGPSDLSINDLIERVEQEKATEIIFALSSTMEGDTTCFYLFKKLGNRSTLISTLARGVAIGDELEYTDEITLGRSLVNRTPYEKSIA